MNILEKLKIIRDQHSGIRDFCIQTIRFKKLLENSNALLDLFEDGHEKVSGEYILDRHYVLSLMDSIIEKLGMIVYDACTLASESGERLYEQYDQLKLKSAELIEFHNDIKKKDFTDMESGDDAPLVYPEYQFLSDVLEWCDGTSPGLTVKNLMKQTMLEGIRGIEAMNSLKSELESKEARFGNSRGNIYLVELWKSVITSLAMPRSLDEVGSIPLKLLLMDAGGGASVADGEISPKTATWVAAANEYEISLNNFSTDFSFRLDATASGYPASDYIFVYADHSLNMDRILPPGFHMEKTDSGSLAWLLDAPAKKIEDSLIIIGRNLFS